MSNLSVNGRRLGKYRRQRGFVLMMLSWSIAAFALISQVYMVQGITGLRVSRWYQQDTQARQFAEATVDTITNFYNRTSNPSCYDWQKTSFGALDNGSCATSLPCTCGADLSTEITNGKNILRDSAGLSGLDSLNIMVQYRITGSAGTKEVSIKAYRDWGINPVTPSANALAVAQLGTILTLHKQVSDGLVGLGNTDVGTFGDINSNVAALGICATPPCTMGLDAMHIRRNTWASGRVLLGALPSAIDPSNSLQYPQWVGDRNDTHILVMEDGSSVMNTDPTTLSPDNISTRIATITSGMAYTIDAGRKTVADMAKVITNVVPSTEISGIMEELSHTHTPDEILANAGLSSCNPPIDVGEFLPFDQPLGSESAICYNYIEAERNATITFRRASGSAPITVYIKDYQHAVPHVGDPLRSVNLGEFVTMRLLDSNGAVVPDGIQIKIANSNPANNDVFTNRNVNLFGSILAPESNVNIGAFNQIHGKTILGRNLRVERMAGTDAPQDPDPNKPLFRVTGVSAWIDRPDPE